VAQSTYLQLSKDETILWRRMVCSKRQPALECELLPACRSLCCWRSDANSAELDVLPTMRVTRRCALPDPVTEGLTTASDDDHCASELK